MKRLSKICRPCSFVAVLIMLVCTASALHAETVTFTPKRYYHSVSAETFDNEHGRSFSFSNDSGKLVTYQTWASDDGKPDEVHDIVDVIQGKNGDFTLYIDDDNCFEFQPNQGIFTKVTTIDINDPLKLLGAILAGATGKFLEIYHDTPDFKAACSKLRRMAGLPTDGFSESYTLDPFLGGNVYFNPVLLLDKYCGIIPYEEFKFGEEYTQLNQTSYSYVRNLDLVSAYGPSDVVLKCDSPVLRSLPEVHPSGVHVTISNDTWYGCKSHEIVDRNAVYTFFFNKDKKKAKKFYKAFAKELVDSGIDVTKGDNKAYDSLREICYGHSPKTGEYWNLKMSEIVGSYLVTFTVYRVIHRK